MPVRPCWFFLKTGRVRYWRSLPPPRTAANSARQIPGAQAEATEWLRQRWTAAVRHGREGCMRESSKTEKTCQQIRAVKGHPRYRLLYEARGCSSPHALVLS